MLSKEKDLWPGSSLENGSLSTNLNIVFHVFVWEILILI